MTELQMKKEEIFKQLIDAPSKGNTLTEEERELLFQYVDICARRGAERALEMC
jgi:hypothetical protein